MAERPRSPFDITATYLARNAVERHFNQIYKGIDPITESSNSINAQIETIVKDQSKTAWEMLGEGTTFAQLYAIVDTANQKTLALEKQHIYLKGALEGFEALTTDTKGHRSNQWFEKTGKFFSVGRASNCVAMAIIHPDIGIAASHKNTVTTDHSVTKLIKLGTDSVYRTWLLSMSEKEQANATISMEDQVAALQTVIEESLEEFITLCEDTKDKPQERATVILYGMDYKPADEADQIGRVANLLLSEHPKLASLGINQVTVHNFVGQRAELVYGGPIHPTYSSPILLPY